MQTRMLTAAFRRATMIPRPRGWATIGTDAIRPDGRSRDQPRPMHLTYLREISVIGQLSTVLLRRSDPRVSATVIRGRSRLANQELETRVGHRLGRRRCVIRANERDEAMVFGRFSDAAG